MKVTSVYGPSRPGARQHFFQDLNLSKPNDDTPWIVGGYFNLTMQTEDRNSSNSDWKAPMDFANTIMELGLVNMRMNGRSFTWSNGRQTPSLARLDRFLITSDWQAQFPNNFQKSLPNTSSDHCPILLSASTTFKKSHIFRVENFWLRSNRFKTFVEQTW